MFSKIRLSILCLLLLAAACKTSKNVQNDAKTSSKKALIPYSVGNYWVYESTLDQSIDTLKVLSQEQTPEGLKVDLNNEKWLVKANGDSIYIRCQSRGRAGANEFVMTRYHRSETPTTFSTCQGDVVQEVKLSKMVGAQTVKGKQYENCYLFEIQPYTKIVIADGIGIIRYSYQDLDGTQKSERLLLNYSLK